MTINFNKIKKYINLDSQKIISFEKIETESLLIQDILNENNHKEILMKI